MYVYICVLVGPFLHCRNYTVSLEYSVAWSPQTQCRSVAVLLPQRKEGWKGRGTRLDFEMDSQPETQGLVQEPQPVQSYSSVVTATL